MCKGFEPSLQYLSLHYKFVVQCQLCAVNLERMNAFMFWSQGQDKENTATVDGSKVKEEELEVAGGKCWRGKWQSALCLIGEIFKRFPMKVIFAIIISVQRNQLQ